MENQILESTSADPNSNGTVRTMLDGKKITIGKNVESFYEKLLNLPVSYKCQLLNLDAQELKSFITERENHFNEKLISLFKKKWLWKIDSEKYDFSDKEINEQMFGFYLTKNQILSKLKRNTFDIENVIQMIDFLSYNEDLKEDYKE